MTIEEAATPAELRAALLADETLGPVAARAVIDVTQVPEIATAMAAAEASRAAESAARTAGNLEEATAAKTEAETQDAVARALRKPYADDARAADRELAEALNVKSIAVKRKVTPAAARSVLLHSEEWGALVLLSRRPFSDDPATNAATAAAINAVETMQPPTTQIDTDEGSVMTRITGSLDALVGAGLIADGTRAALLALADAVVSPWERVYGLGAIADAGKVSILMRGV